MRLNQITELKISRFALTKKTQITGTALERAKEIKAGTRKSENKMRAYQREYHNNRYKNDIEYQKRRKEQKQKRYKDDPEFRKKNKEYSSKYQKSDKWRQYHREYCKVWRAKRKAAEYLKMIEDKS